MTRSMDLGSHSDRRSFMHVATVVGTGLFVTASMATAEQTGAGGACTNRTRRAKTRCLFPALRSVVSRNEFDALGEDFEQKEHQLFGQDGFEKMVDRVASIEKSLGIYHLAQFTPRASRGELSSLVVN